MRISNGVFVTSELPLCFIIYIVYIYIIIIKLLRQKDIKLFYACTVAAPARLTVFKNMENRSHEP